MIICKKQKRVKEETADYGILKYNSNQLKLHIEVMKLLTSTRHKKIKADECMVVFGRIYSIYVQSQVQKEKEKVMKNE